MAMIPSINLKPGMVVSSDIIQDGKVLIPKGVTLTSHHIERINDFGVDHCFITDEYQTQFDVNQAVAQTTLLLAKGFAANLLRPTPKNPFPHKTLSVIEKQLNTILSDRIVLDKLLDVRTIADHTYRHSVRVAVLALAVGASQNLSTDQLKVLGTAGLLHDIGKRAIPKDVLIKDEKLTAHELQFIHQHPLHSFKILRDTRGIHPDVANITLQHHERFNGTGYPQGIGNNAMSMMSKILALADVYEAITGDRAHRKRYSPAEAAEYLLGSIDNLFDGQVVNSFVEHLAVYQLGSMVRLNTGEVGMVTDISRHISTRPILMLIYNAQGERYPTPREIDLNRADHLTVVIEQVLD